MKFQPATMDELTDIMEIIAQGQDYLKQRGIQQWQNGYPSWDVIAADIRRGNSYVLKVEEKVLGTAALEFDGDPNYENIYQGGWLSNGAYAAIHRIAIAAPFKGQGLASTMVDGMVHLCLERSVYSLRVDTHRTNHSMQSMLQKNGFKQCGIIFLADGSERLAFERLLQKAARN